MGDDYFPDGYFNPTELRAQADGIEITVDQTMEARVVFETAISLPDQYNYTDSASYEETVAVALWFPQKGSLLALYSCEATSQVACLQVYLT